MTNDYSAANNLVEDRVKFHHDIGRGKKESDWYVGYLSNLIPLEIIHASGATAIMLCGDCAEEPVLANEFMEAAFDPITRSVFNRILKGEYNFLDLIVLPRGHDSYQRLYYYLCEIHRKYPQYNIPPVYLFDLAYSQKTSSENHNSKRLADFVACLQTLTEQNIDDQRLQTSITLYNTCRTTLANFNTLRVNKFVSSVLAYKVYASLQSLSIDEANQRVSALNAEIRLSEDADNNQPKLILVGNSVDHPALHHTVDQADARIVGDYHFYGHHFLTGTVDANTSPTTALLQHYTQQVPCTRSVPPSPNVPTLYAKQQQADGLIFFFLQGEEALTWQAPEQKAFADKSKLANIMFYDQEYTLASEGLKATLSQFIQSLVANRGAR